MNKNILNDALPLEDFRKLYRTASADEKEEIYLMVKQDANDLISEARAFIKETSLRIQLNELLKIIPLAYIARKYFGKSRNWLYQRVNGYMVNGKPAKFTSEELKKLSVALVEISDEIRTAALKIAS